MRITSPEGDATFSSVDRSTRNGIAFALLAALFWGVSGAIAADAFAEVPPARVAEVRALVTSVFFIPFALYRGSLAPQGGLGWFALLGLLLAGSNVTFYWAMERLGVGPGATIQFLAPIFVLVWMVLAQHRTVSATVWVAAVVAVNALLDTPLPTPALLEHALEGEKYASGGLHADNVAPCLLGGLVLCPRVLLPQAIPLPVPAGVSAVLIHPNLQVNTAQARRGLARGYTMEQWLSQQGYLAGFIAACAASDVDLMRRTLKDVIIEPH